MDVKYIEYKDGIVTNGMFKGWKIAIARHTDELVTLYTLTSNQPIKTANENFSFSCAQNGYPNIVEQYAVQRCAITFAETMFNNLNMLSKNMLSGHTTPSSLIHSFVKDTVDILPQKFYKNETFREILVNSLAQKSRELGVNTSTEYWNDYIKTAKMATNAITAKISKIEKPSKQEKINADIEETFGQLKNFDNKDSEFVK